MLTIFLAAFVIIVVVTLVLLARYPYKPLEGELYRIKETGITAVLGAFLWLEVCVILYYGFTNPERLITSNNSRINVCIFLTLSMLLGAGMLLYYFAKSIIVCEDRVIFSSFYCKSRTIKWKEITKVGSNIGKRIVLFGDNNAKITVGGERKAFKEFIKLACEKIHPRVGGDILLGLKKSLKI